MPTRVDTKYSTIRDQEVVDYRGTVESTLPVMEANVVQLRPGPPPSNLEILCSKNAFILGLHHYAASVGVVILNPDHFGFMWWDGNEDCRINGQPARRRLIYMQGAQDGFHAAGGARRTMGVAVRRNKFIETLAALMGVAPEDVRLRRAGLELSPAAARRFRSNVDVVVRKAMGLGSEISARTGKVDLGETIIGLLVDAYFHSPPVAYRNDRPRQLVQIVRQAEERFFASQGSAVSLADLCSATGVSQSTLYRAFDAVCGEPPLAYFRKRRFTNARQALLKTPKYRGAVKQIALDAGLTEFGRFSVEYRELFGELPTTTLSKNIP